MNVIIVILNEMKGAKAAGDGDIGWVKLVTLYPSPPPRLLSEVSK